MRLTFVDLPRMWVGRVECHIFCRLPGSGSLCRLFFALCHLELFLNMLTY